jgi:heme/copper-type cytochrome/quinol oxidase subunit 2
MTSKKIIENYSNENNNSNFTSYIVAFIALIIITIGIILIFFTDFIYNAKDKIKHKIEKVYYFKWIMMLFTLNIIFLIAISIMNSYKKNIYGDQGPAGFTGKKGKSGNKCEICVKDNHFNYKLDHKFQNDKWRK